MKLLLLNLCALFVTPACAMMSDTIILNAGKNSKIIFYGKSPQDLKNLEMLDLNKIIKDLNERQTASDSASRQLVKLDERGYLIPSLSEMKTSRKDRYLANTFLNFYVGKGNDRGRYIFFQPPPTLLGHPTARLTNEVILQNKLSVHLTVVHDMKIIDNVKYTLAFRYGLGVGFNLHRYVHWTLLQSVNEDDPAEIVRRSRDLIRRENIKAGQSDFSAFQSHIQFAPKLSIRNAKGQSTFFFSTGIRLNYNRFFENVDPEAYSNGISVNSSRGVISNTRGPVISGGGYSVYSKKSTFSPSYLTEAGYKWIGLFVSLYPTDVILTTKSMDTDRPGSGFIKDKKGKIGYISFGIKLGR